MNNVSPSYAYRGPSPQQQTGPSAHYQQRSGGDINDQQQNVNSHQPPRSFAAPYTANVFGGEARFQPIPTLSFYPRAYATIAARLTPIPGGPSVGVSATARFDPAITLRPTEAGGLHVSFVPRMQIAASGDVRAGIPNIFNTGFGINAGARLTQFLNFSAPEFSANIEPNGAFNFKANLNPTISTQQFAGVDGGVEGNVSVPVPGPVPGLSLGAGGGVNQSITGGPGHEIKVGGPGIEFAMSASGKPTITHNVDRTVSVANSYTFFPRSSINANVHAGPVTVTTGAGVTPTFTVQHRVTFSTDLASKMTPKHEFSATPGVAVDGSFGVRVSLLPREWPVSITKEIGADPRATVTTRASYTV
ncbi:hypothetical protein [Pseudomonas sp. 1152_12]|uniref:hypothetical protein n=1 Tax=Pseudomonas sp. 1152_12 TaxID=2604455 RepID=UPI004062DA09